MNKDFTQQKEPSDKVRTIMFFVFALYICSGMLLTLIGMVTNAEFIASMPYLLSVYFLVDFLVGVVIKEFYTFGFMIKKSERPFLFWLRGLLVLSVAIAIILMISLFK